MPDVADKLTGQTAVVTGEKDAAPIAKILKMFAAEFKIAALKIVRAQNGPPIGRLSHVGFQMVVDLLFSVLQFLGGRPFVGHVLKHLVDFLNHASGIGRVAGGAGRELAGIRVNPGWGAEGGDGINEGFVFADAFDEAARKNVGGQFQGAFHQLFRRRF